MPIISDIQAQKNKERLNIYLDGKFGFGVGRAIWLVTGYKVGTNLSAEEIKVLQGDEQKNKAEEKILHFISFRPRSEKEILTKFAEVQEKLEISETDKEEILVKLRKYNYLNDEEFGRWWIGERKKRLKGQNVIKQELYQKGLTQELVTKLLEEEEIPGLEEAVKVLEKAKWRFQGDEFQRKRKMWEMLIRRGFTGDTIAQAISKMIPD